MLELDDPCEYDHICCEMLVRFPVVRLAPPGFERLNVLVIGLVSSTVLEDPAKLMLKGTALKESHPVCV